MSFSSNIFKLNEIQFSNEMSDVDSESNSLSLNTNSLNLHRYPRELGSAGLSHYITFEIFARSNINKDFNVDVGSEEPVSYQITKLLAQNRGQKLDLRSAQDVVMSAVGTTAFTDLDAEVTSVTGGTSTAYKTRMSQIKKDNEFSLPKLKKTKELIALYMPDTLNFSYNQNFENMSINEKGGNFLMGAQAVAAGLGAAAAGKNISSAAKQMSPFAAELVEKKLKTGGLILGSLGFAINPAMEVIFTGTNLRQFSFDFLFYPRDEDEALAVYRIIQAFKFHASPEITSGTAGRYLLAPSAFDIKFMYNGEENPNIPKISTCFCNSISTDYAPNGFSAYEVQGSSSPTRGGTGTPVATRLTLSFTETTMITKELLRGSVLNGSSFSGAF